jgi:dienelactone hydrolase
MVQGESSEREATMKRIATLAALAVLLIGCRGTAAQESVHFPSLDDNGPGQTATVLDGYLYRAPGNEPRPAIIGLHGCSGMFSRTNGLITPLYRQWAAEFNRHGYTVLLVDSFGPRNHGEMCSIQGFDLELYRKRPKDAYGALWFLQKQPFVRPDRIGVVGWSQGGGVTLLSIGAQSLGRPSALPQGDFRAAVAFYPASCDERREPPSWTSAIPLLVLQGAEDVWTPMAPCKAFLDGAIARGASIEMQIYPGAYHAFDAPNVPRRELPDYRTRAGVVPIVGTDADARTDALARVPAFLGRFLGDFSQP